MIIYNRKWMKILYTNWYFSNELFSDKNVSISFPQKRIETRIDFIPGDAFQISRFSMYNNKHTSNQMLIPNNLTCFHLK